MKLTTKNFGEIDVDESKIINFAEGLPGFPDDKRFILLDTDFEPEEGAANPFLWLQSVDNGDVAFILMDAFMVIKNYAPELNTADYSELGEYTDETKQDFLIYNIVVLPEDIKEMSVNLVAPVIINQVTKKGKQVVAQNTDYSIRHMLYQDPENPAQTYEA